MGSTTTRCAAKSPRGIAILRIAEHPAVVRCHGMYKRGGELQILLEYMDGGSLDGRRIASEPFLTGVACQIDRPGLPASAGAREILPRAGNKRMRRDMNRPRAMPATVQSSHRSAS